MTRDEFLNRLEKALAPLGGEERERTVDYYREMIDDRLENGMSEAEAVAGMEDVNVIAGALVPNAPKNPVKSSNPLRTALLIIGSPIWVSLLAALAALVLAILAALISLIAALITVELALALSGVAMFIATFPIVSQNLASGAFVLGMGCVLTGIALIAYPLVRSAATAMVGAVMRIYGLTIKKMFKKGEKRE